MIKNKEFATKYLPIEEALDVSFEIAKILYQDNKFKIIPLYTLIYMCYSDKVSFSELEDNSKIEEIWNIVDAAIAKTSKILL